MKEFYNSFSFILAFLLLTLIFNMLFGGKATEFYLLLILLSMVVVNSDKFSKIFNGLEGMN